MGMPSCQFMRLTPAVAPLTLNSSLTLCCCCLNSPSILRSTHWKQTVFYLEDVITICAGETIEGLLECKPNDKNPRDLDISISYSFEGKHGECKRTQAYRMR